jgi:prepilin-type N-terminal cleavage/methylation domain-containing protein
MDFGTSRLAQAAFALIEIIMAVAIVAFLAAVALPNFVRARKRSLAAQISNSFRVVDARAT